MCLFLYDEKHDNHYKYSFLRHKYNPLSCMAAKTLPCSNSDHNHYSVYSAKLTVVYILVASCMQFCIHIAL